MGAVLADTHAIIWYMRSPERLSAEAQRLLDSSDPVLVSCVSVVEAVYLADKGMPDRIIAATALHLGVPLVTRDRRIRATGVPTVW